MDSLANTAHSTGTEVTADVDVVVVDSAATTFFAAVAKVKLIEVLVLEDIDVDVTNAGAMDIGTATFIVMVVVEDKLVLDVVDGVVEMEVVVLLLLLQQRPQGKKPLPSPLSLVRQTLPL